MKRSVVWMPGDVRTELHVTAAALCLLVDQPPAGWSLPPHRHIHEAETIHILRGQFDLDIEQQHTVLGPGDTAHVPVGVKHSGGNVGLETGKRLVIFTPGGIEGFWLEVGKQAPGSAFDSAAVVAAARRWGWDFAVR